MKRIVLVGLSGTGKSSVGRLLADRLGYAFIDTDDEISRLFERSVAAIFDAFGEAVFRAAERQAIGRAAARRDVVIATGGGAIADDANLTALRPESLIVLLTATPATIVERLATQVGDDPKLVRPLLAGPDDPTERIRGLWETRRGAYLQADVTVDTTGKSVAEVVAEIAKLADAASESGLIPLTSIGTPAGRSDIHIGLGVRESVGVLLRRRWPEARRLWLVTDDQVAAHWLEPVAGRLAAEGYDVAARAVPAGEGSKSLERVQELLDWLIGERVERRDVLIALGGGVVGDLAGFVASIVLRGIGLIQVPTSLLAMVDSSVGGKTGVNHPLGKNLIGTFYQPPLVLVDPAFLTTLPDRQMRAGWAEIIKYAMIERTAVGDQDAPLLDALARADLARHYNDPELVTDIIGRSVRLKAAVVQADERESGVRRLLNYGHTLGHAMEAAGYRYLHGEAVALGMRAAARIAERLSICPTSLVTLQDRLLDDLGLPREFVGSRQLVMDRLAHDKKSVSGTLTWILPTAPGEVTFESRAPIAVVEDVAGELGAR